MKEVFHLAILIGLLFVIVVGGLYFLQSVHYIDQVKISNLFSSRSVKTGQPISLMVLAKPVVEPGNYRITGFVVKTSTCPACPVAAQCKPCPVPYLVLGATATSTATSAPHIMVTVKDTRVFVIGREYHFTVAVTSGTAEPEITVSSFEPVR